MMAVTFLDATRWWLVVACAISSVAAGWVAHATHPRYTPLMVLVSFWSFAVAGGLADFYSESWSINIVSADTFRAAFNTAAGMMVAGWAVFGLWVAHDARRLRAAIPVIDEASAALPAAAAFGDVDE